MKILVAIKQVPDKNARLVLDAVRTHAIDVLMGVPTMYVRLVAAARPDVDAVVIGTPDHWHCQMVLDAVKAGKDIYCEKGLSRTLAEAKRMRDALKHPVTLLVAAIVLLPLVVRPAIATEIWIFAMFGLGKMDVERRALPVRRKRSRQMQFFDAVRVSDPTEREPFTRVFEFNRESRVIRAFT